MAADLQEPPELAVEFFRRLEQDTCDVVCGVRAARDDPLQTRLASTLFWAAYRRLVQPEMPPGGVDVFGCNVRARDTLVALTETHSSLIGQLLWIGMRRAEVPYRRRARPHGKSAWTLRKKLAYMVDSSLAFSDLPIRMLFAVGMLALAVAIVYGAIVLVARLTGLIVEPGYAPTVLLIAGFGALNALGLSVVGAYAWRAFENTKGRPLRDRAAAVHVRGGRQSRERLRPSAGDLRDEGSRTAHAHLGVRARAARGRASAPTATSATTCSSRTTSSSVIASR